MKKKHHPLMEYNVVTPEIYLGTNMCCDTHFGKLLKLGIVADLSLEKERHEHPVGLEYYLLLPVTDKYPPSIKQMHVGSKFIRQVIRNKGRVYVHCKYGHGRSPTLVAAYLISEGLGVDEAVKLIAAARPEIHLNKRQSKALEQYKESLTY